MVAIISILGKLTLTDWGSWAAIIAGSIAFIGFIFYIATLVINKVKSYRLFKAYYEQEDDEFTSYLTIKNSSQEWYLRITLIMKTAASIDFIKIAFKGNGSLPIIKTLSDRDYPWGPNTNIITIREKGTETGWKQLQQKHRDEGDKIRINILCLARTSFDGHLVVFLSCNKNLKRKVLLPLQIIGDDNAKAAN